MKHSKNEFANGKNCINGIENFFSKRVRAQELRLRLATASRRGYAKHRLSKFKGIKKENFLLHLKECVLLYFTVFVAFQDAVTSGLEPLGDGS